MRLPNCVPKLVFAGILAASTHAVGQTTNPPVIPVISALEASNYLNQQVIVVDKVVQLAFRSNIWILHLDQKYPNSPLNGTIRKVYTNNFVTLDQYLDQRVQINGQISVYRGRVEIALTSTNQIKILGPNDIVPAPAPVLAQMPVATAAPLATPPLATNLVAATAPVPSAATRDPAGRTLNWILAFLALISMLLAVGIFMFWRRQTAPPNSLLPASANPLTRLPEATATAPDTASVETWKQRALTAEAMAGKQGEMLREKMMPELTEFAKQSLVQGLYAQRNALMETQRKAQQALTDLETRLATLQMPLNERIRAYEKRIAELEREVETQGEEMRELSRATLTLVRKKLEEERHSGQTGGRLHTRLN